MINNYTMIKSFSIENYKAFEKGTIELKPITILLGANSVGKSSLIQLLLLMQQTANANKGYKSALKLNGNLVSLGESVNIFRNKNTKNPVVFSFEFEDESLYLRLKKTYLEDFVSEMVQLYRNVKMEYLYRNQKRKPTKDDQEIINYETFIENNELDRLIRDSIKDRSFFKGLLEKISDLNFPIKKGKEVFFIIRQETLLESENIDNYLDLYDFLKSFTNIKEKLFAIRFEIKYKSIVSKTKNENVLYLSKLILSNNNKLITSFEILPTEKDVTYSLSTPYAKDGKELLGKSIQKDIGKYIGNYQSTIFSILKRPTRYLDDEYFFERDVLSNDSYVFIKKIFDILSSSIATVESYFLKEQINYVSPLRAYPRRYYLLDKANISAYLDTLDGDAIVEVLKANPLVKSRVNKWFNNFQLKIDVKVLQDTIHKLTVEQHCLELDITDVGFGISQVLPIVVQGFFSSNNTLTMMEQPEVHLHPKMQADLSDLFIDIIKTNRKKPKSLLIETHSEYILNRLRRRIAEGKKITNEDVAIYLITREGDLTLIKNLEVPEKGNFEYPEDFYGGELFKDTMIFLKSQNS